MDERERLIKELDNFLQGTGRPSWLIADFILSDRKRICEPLVKVKSTSHGREEFEALNYAINQTLTLAGLDEGEREK